MKRSAIEPLIIDCSLPLDKLSSQSIELLEGNYKFKFMYYPNWIHFSIVFLINLCDLDVVHDKKKTNDNIISLNSN